jgi:hypothetical protein
MVALSRIAKGLDFADKQINFFGENLRSTPTPSPTTETTK